MRKVSIDFQKRSFQKKIPFSSMYYTRELVLTRNCPLDEIFTVIEKFEIGDGNINCWTVRATAAGRNDHMLVGRVDRYILNNFANAVNYEEFLHVEYNQVHHFFLNLKV